MRFTPILACLGVFAGILAPALTPLCADPLPEARSASETAAGAALIPPPAKADAAPPKADAAPPEADAPSLSELLTIPAILVGLVLLLGGLRRRNRNAR